MVTAGRRITRSASKSLDEKRFMFSRYYFIIVYFNARFMPELKLCLFR